MNSPSPAGSPGPSAGSPVLIAPSVLAADLADLAGEVKRAIEAGADLIHLDVMDGLFVPNLTFGAPVVKALRSHHPEFPLEAHLMVREPGRLVPAFVAARCDYITIHVEADTEEGVSRALEEIRGHGVKAGLSLRPGTPLERLARYLPQLDLLLVMSVEPGFSHQPFVEGALPRLGKVRELRGSGDHAFLIGVDGGINPEKACEAAKEGAELFVAGGSLYGPGDMKARLTALREAAEKGR